MRGQFLRRLLLRVLDPKSKIDYGILFFVGGLPVVTAYFLNAHQSHQIGDTVYLGYWVKSNFWPFMFGLPIMLWLTRLLFNRIAPVSASDMQKVPPILKSLNDPGAQRQAYMEMRHYLSSPLLAMVVLALAATIQALDMAELLGVYLANDPIRAGETDWSVMYAAGVMSKAENFVFVLMAYTVQFTLICFQCFLLVFLLAHNLFFLNRVYQRRRVPEGMEAHYIQIDLDDLDHCFGLRGANDAFNTQLLLLIVFGLLAMLPRFNNVYVEGAPLSFDHFTSWPLQLPDINYFPDVGQVLLATFWLLTFFTVVLPSLIKLLPWFSNSFKITEISVTDYIKEFVPPDEWPYEKDLKQQDIDLLAAKFASNAFWPTGDNRASLFFFFCGWIFLVILLPIQTEDNALLVAAFALLGALAYLFRTVMFTVLRLSLTFIDERLATPKPVLLLESAPTVRPTRIDGRVFISYRREDASAYARLIQQSLEEFIEPEKVFMDRVAIHDGDDFVAKITDAVLECDALLVVIGPNWTNCTNADGERRIMQADDFVRLEIETGLANQRPVIPVLVGGARMPNPEDVPLSLSPLVRRHARELSDSRWDYDVSELAKNLVEKAAPKPS